MPAISWVKMFKETVVEDAQYWPPPAGGACRTAPMTQKPTTRRHLPTTIPSGTRYNIVNEWELLSAGEQLVQYLSRARARPDTRKGDQSSVG